MNGTGPFRLKENRGQAGYSFVANDTYWGGKPAIDAVEFTVLDDNARVAALRGGQIDIAVQIELRRRAPARRARRSCRSARPTTATST